MPLHSIINNAFQWEPLQWNIMSGMELRQDYSIPRGQYHSKMVEAEMISSGYKDNIFNEQDIILKYFEVKRAAY